MTIEDALSLAVSHENAGRLTEAEALYRQVATQVPDHAPAQYHLGVVLQLLGRFEESIAPFELATTLRPGAAEAWVNLTNAYRGVGRMEEALVVADRAVALAPHLPEAQFNRGSVLHMLARWSEALAAYDRAIALRPDFARARLNRAILLLLLGDFERGLPEYEWRIPLLPRQTPSGAKSWRGEPLTGERLLVDMEQGYGDMLQFCRYVPLMADRGATVIVRCDAGLVSLVKTLKGASEVVPFESEPIFDLRVWMLSLPLLFGTRMETIPANVPYLHADAQRVTAWKARIGSKNDCNVGLCWSGNPDNTDNVNRSIDPALLAPLLAIPGARFFSLQKGAAQSPLQLTDFTGELHDWADTAALMRCLDLVITIDTGILHLAGALGMPAWGLLAHVPDWRYFLDRDDSPWYPTLKLYRQPARNDWASVIERVCADLPVEARRHAKH